MHPELLSLGVFPEDVVARAKHLITGAAQSSFGAYSHSQGHAALGSFIGTVGPLFKTSFLPCGSLLGWVPESLKT